MELSIYNVIKGPVLSDKAQALNREQQKLVLEVDLRATKPMVKEALLKLFNVQAEKVNMVVRKGKFRRAPGTRRQIQGSDRKQAIITLKAGQNLDLFGQQEVQAASTEAASE